MEDTQEELNEEDIEESTADVDTPPEEVVEEEIVDTPTYLRMLLEKARAAAPQLSRLIASVKNEALVTMAEGTGRSHRRAHGRKCERLGSL